MPKKYRIRVTRKERWSDGGERGGNVEEFTVPPTETVVVDGVEYDDSKWLWDLTPTDWPRICRRADSYNFDESRTDFDEEDCSWTSRDIESRSVVEDSNGNVVYTPSEVGRVVPDHPLASFEN